MVMNEIESTASRLGLDLSSIDLHSIRLPPGDDFGILRCVFIRSCFRGLQNSYLIAVCFVLFVVCKMEKSDFYTQLYLSQTRM